MKVRHSFRYTVRRGDQTVAQTFDLEADRLGAIEHALRTLRDLNLSQIEAACGDWHRTLCPGCFWAAGSGIVIAKVGSSPKRKDSVVRFLGSCPGLRETDWCYHFTSQDPELEGEARRYVESRINPLLAQHFERARAFVFHCCDGPPAVPPWLDGEFDEGARVVILYGLATARTPATR